MNLSKAQLLLNANKDKIQPQSQRWKDFYENCSFVSYFQCFALLSSFINASNIIMKKKIRETLPITNILAISTILYADY